MAAPAELWVVHLHLNTRAGCDGSPAVQARVVKWRDKIAKPFRPHCDTAADPNRKRHIELFNVNGERLPIPVQTAGANLVMMCAARNVLSAALCHGPTLTPFAIQRHIQSAMVFRISKATVMASRPCVVGREYTAYKGDDGEPVFAVVT